MENQELRPHGQVYSRSALHAFITGPGVAADSPKSSFNPYRKRANLLSMMSLEKVEESLTQAIETQALPEGKIESQNSTPKLPLSELPAPS